MQPPPAPPGVVDIFQPTYRGLQHFFIDSTIYQPRLYHQKREVTLDSALNFITVKETFNDKPFKLPQTMTLEYYIRARTRFDNQQRWYDSVLKTQAQTEQRGGQGIVLNIPVKIKSKAFKRIFGGDRVGLRVSGNITFELAGRTESREGSAVSSFEERGTFSPKFKQTQQFRVEGRVGDKVTVSVDQNSEATFDFENTLKLSYQGDEDEIVQKIEAGNVNLSLPSTNYVSTSANHQGLFGLKTQMQVGNFSFTGIASLERGDNQKLSISGASKEQTHRVKDYEYERNRFFFVDNYYLDTYESSIDPQRWILVLDPNRKVLQLDVWKTASPQTPYNETRQAVAAYDPDSILTTQETFEQVEEIPGNVEKGRFERLKPGEDYEFDFQRGFFWLKSTPSENEVVAISYAYGPNESNLSKVGMLFQDIDSLTAIDSTITVVFKLIKPRANNPSYPTWDLTMRNVYNLGAAGVTPEGFDLKVLYSVTGEDQEVDEKSGKTYNFLLGLDRVNEQDQVIDGGDKKVDLNRRFIFDLGDGYLFFPTLHPFDPTPGSPFDFDKDRHVEIYNITNTTEERSRSKFELEITTKAVSNKFDLGFNVLEGSEKVTLNGRLLERDKDYTVDYFSGTLEIIAPEARRADAQVEIEYERGQLFQLDKKTLLGGRLEYAFGERNFLGLTAVYFSQSTLDQRIRLGQEPLRNLVWDVNTALHFKPNFLTSFLDWLPIVETSAESKLKIEAEYAQVNPNPNTFNEPAIGDRDGVAYIDDFEGSKRFTSLGVQYRIWSTASVPLRFRRLSTPMTDYSVADFPSKKDYILTMDRNRVTFHWFNPFNQVPIRSIFPNKEVNAQTGTGTTVLMFRWRNDQVDPDSAWGGVMRSTASFPNQEQTRFIEMWVKGNTGQINIDIGRISEDYWVRGTFFDPVSNSEIPSYGNLNTEDRNLNGLLDIEAGEDTGIDGVAGKDGNNVPGDAGDDDWAEPRATKPFFARINGTEGNSNARGARSPDTEDLDGDGTLNLFNDYFEYSFDLNDPANDFLVDSTAFDDGTPTGWKLYRIPLRDYSFKVGNPDTNFQQIFSVRIWINDIQPGAGKYDSLQIATMDFVGNEWEEIGIAESDTSKPVLDEEKFGVAVINTEESNIYQSPPGVTGIRDRITRVLSKEQSLVLNFIDLQPGARAEAKKQLRQKINLINYKKLKMFVHGDEKLMDTDSLIFYMRFGPTEKIFYEYSEVIKPGWAEENKIEIDFAELAQTKNDKYLLPDSLDGQKVHFREDPNYPGKYFKVVGNPGLHNINYFVFGARNAGSNELREVQIWLDELRVTGVERESGTAMRLFTELGIADIANVRAQWELVDDNFRRIENKFASNDGKDRTQEKQSYFASVRLGKFLPEGWGIEIPVDAKYTRIRSIPKYFYNSDRPTNYQISGFSNRLKTFFGLSDVPAGLADQINLTESRSIGGTFRRKDRQRDPWYLRLTLNQLVLDADYSEKHASSPTTEYNNSTSFSGQVSYKIPFGKNNYFKPFGWMGKGKLINFLSNMKVYYTPSATQMSFALTDNESQQKNRLEAQASAPSINVKTSRKFSISYKLLESLSLDLSRDYQSDAFLKGYRAKDALNAIFRKLDFGVDRRISQRFSVGYNPKLFTWLSSNYRYNSNFIYNFENPQINARSSTLNVNHTFHVDFKPSILVSKIYTPKTTPRAASQRRGSGRRGGGKDSDKNKEGEKGQDKKGGAPNPAMMLWHFFNAFKAIAFDFTFQNDYGHHNLARVPVLNYQFGFNSDPQAGVDTTFDKIFLLPNIRKNRGINGSLQIDIVRNLTSSFKYNYQKVQTQANEQQTQSINNTVFFTGEDPDANRKPWWNLVPDWRLSLSGVEKLPLFKLFARSATLEHARTGKFTESSRIENDIKKRDQWGYSINYQPFLGLTVNTIWNVNATLRKTLTTSFDYRTAGAVTKRVQSGLNVSVNYSVTRGFRLPIPFLKKKKLNNEIQFSLSFDKTSSENFSRGPGDTEFQELDITQNQKLRPSISYRFSQKVNGTAFFEMSSSENKRTGKTSTKEFGINVNIAIR